MSGPSASRGLLITIGDKERVLFETLARMSLNYFGFGHPKTKTTFNSYILQLPGGDYSIYRPKQWNHFCFAWSARGRSQVILV